MRSAELDHAPRTDWMYRSVLSGFSASGLMLGALYTFYYGTILVARGLDPAGHDLPSNNAGFFTSATAHNSLIALGSQAIWLGLMAHLVIGLSLALAYGYFVEPRLQGNSWLKGLQFSTLPFLLSLAAMPIVGIHLSALTVMGSLLVHAVYGLTLGGVFGSLGDVRMSRHVSVGDVMESKTMERGGARGIVKGAALGLILAGVLHAGFGSASLTILNYSVAWVYAATVLFCASLGFLVGMVVSTPRSATMA